MRALLVVGARPNFVKAMPLFRRLEEAGHAPTLVHTGQHHDAKMSGDIFRDLEMGAPEIQLGLGGLERSQFVMQATLQLRRIIREQRPTWVVVFGDVNSTLAGALAGSKERVSVAHVEAGLRSGDERMVEEFNRKQVDALSDALFATTAIAVKNLKTEGMLGDVHLVGNVMMDTLVWATPRIHALGASIQRGYGVVTLHRPELVDDAAILSKTVQALNDIASTIPLKFPVHPRTRTHIVGIRSGVEIVDPLPYLQFLALVSKAAFVITDSGGLQEETTFLGVPCLTLRDSTERPETIEYGTNKLVSLDDISQEVIGIVEGHQKTRPGEIPLWDGQAAKRIVAALEHYV